MRWSPRLVALPAHLADSGDLFAFKLRVDAKDVDRHLFIHGEVVDAITIRPLLLELRLVAERGVGDLLLEELASIAGMTPPRVFDLLEVPLRGGPSRRQGSMK